MTDFTNAAISMINKKHDVFRQHEAEGKTSESLLRTLLCEVDVIRQLFQEVEGQSSATVTLATEVRSEIFDTLKHLHGG